MDWLKFYHYRWLHGSSRVMSLEARAVWIDLLSLAKETKFQDGTLRFEVGEPMPRDYIAAIMRVPMETLNECIEIYQKDINVDNGKARVQVWDDGTIELTNFERYQSVPENKGKLTGRELELHRRQRLNRDAALYPIEALNVPEVKAIVKGELDDKKNTT